MSSYTGTVLGGPQDGEIFTTEGTTLFLPELVRDLEGFTAEKSPSLITEETWTAVAYHWRMDDDGRGWWARQRP